MSAPISSIQKLVQSSIDSRREEIRLTQQKADDAIRELRSTGYSQVADILLARYEELRKRSSKFSREYPGGTTTALEESADKADETDFEIKLEHLEDGSLKFTLPPDETEEKHKVYILRSPNFDKENPVQNIIIVAEEMANAAINCLDKLPNLAISKMEYLTEMCESLTAQKKEINSQKEAGGSPIALEVAAQFYLNDAFKFLQSVQMIVNAGQDRLDESAKA